MQDKVRDGSRRRRSETWHPSTRPRGPRTRNSPAGLRPARPEPSDSCWPAIRRRCHRTTFKIGSTRGAASYRPAGRRRPHPRGGGPHPALPRPRNGTGVRGAPRWTRHRVGVPSCAGAGEASDHGVPGTGRYGRRLGPARRPPPRLHRARHGRHLAAMIGHLPAHRVHLLGHSRGGLVARYHALHCPDQLAGMVLYESAPVTGPEFGEEMMLRAGEFAARHAGRPELQAVMEAFATIPTIADDEAMVAAARGIVPAYVADYWADAQRWGRLQGALRASRISGQDEHGEPDVVDDREALGVLRLPVLVVAGRHDVVCGVRWAEELHKLIPGAQPLVLERSDHFGHLEEPERFAREVSAFVAAGNS
ncbi:MULTISPECIES: alpha/beta hydrolase [unclassified Streptomyces]|uniref:alpha/beta fold hydrolase n=1 Tax=unclassified Streptomyces TaxID=2593676 RepID=UPI00341CAE13